MAESELEIGIKSGLPVLVYKRKWVSRGDELIDQVSEQTGISRDGLGRMIAENDRWADVLGNAVDRAAGVTDELYRSVLGRLVAGACDDALIDEVEYMLAEIVKLQPLQLRALFALFAFFDEEGNEGDFTTMLLATTAVARDLTHAQLATVLGASGGLTASAINVLVTADWVAVTEAPAESTYEPTRWGCDALAVAFPSLSVLEHDGDRG